MNHIKILQDIKKYLEDELCSKISSKKPDNEINDERYKLELVNPKVHLGALPIGNENVQDAPSFILSINEATRTGNKSNFKLRINIVLWSPGKYLSESYKAIDDPNALGGKSYKKQSPTQEKYERDDSGFIELWNLIDKTVDLIQSNALFAGHAIDHENIKYDQFRDSEGYPLDFYPYYMGYIDIPFEKESKKVYQDIHDML